MTTRSALRSPEAILASIVRELQAAAIAPARMLIVTSGRAPHAFFRDVLERANVPAARVRTCAGVASTLLAAAGERFRSGRLLGALATRALVDIAFAATPTPSFAPHQRAAPRFAGDIARVIGELARYDDAARARIAANATPHLRDLLAIDATYRAALARAGAFDRGSMIARALAAMRDGDAAARSLAAEYDAVVFYAVEDFQLGELALAAGIARHVRIAHAIEEPDAALAFAYDTEPGARARETLAAHASFSIAETGGDARAIVEVLKAGTPRDEAALVSERIASAIANGTEPSAVGVVLRAPEPFGAMLERALEARGISAAGAPGLGLRDDEALAFVRSALDLFAAPLLAARWAHVVGSPLIGGNAVHVRLACLREPPASFADGLERLLAGAPNGENAKAVLENAFAAWSDDDFARCVRILIRDLALPAVLRENPRDVHVRVARLRAFGEAAGDLARVVRDNGAPAGSAALYTRLEAHAAELASDLRAEEPGAGVRILDIHESKFAKFELVIVPEAVEARWSARVRGSALFDPGDRAALAAAGVALQLARENGDDPRERRRWFVAAERERAQTIASYAVTDVENQPARPALLLPAEALPAPELPAFARPYDPSENAFASAPRSRALRTLGAQLAVRAEASYDPVNPRPVIRQPALTASQIDQWLRCPRRFYYGTVAGIPSEPNIAMSLGGALHRVLERFHTNETDFSDVDESDVPNWHAQLSAIFEGIAHDIAPGEPALNTYAVYVIRRMLADYAQALFVEAREHPFFVEACEREVEFELGRARVRGRIDRLDRLVDGGAVIRDYKTGQKHVKLEASLAKAAAIVAEGSVLEGAAPEYTSLQLALYRLAVPDARRLHVLYFGGENTERDRIADDDTVVDETLEAHIATLTGYVRRALAEPLTLGTIARFATVADVASCRNCDYLRICPGAGSR